jgi:curved DNA-binding protein CbpA
MSGHVTDHYAVLGVSRSATEQEIRVAFRALAYLHPDKHPNDKTARDRFARITEAYAVLSNADQRARYDRGVADCEIPPVEVDEPPPGHVTDAVEMAVEIAEDVQKLDARAGLRVLDHLASKEGRQQIRSTWGTIRELWNPTPTRARNG